MQPALIDIRPQHRIDEQGLWKYLAAHLPGFTQPATLRQFQGGQSNPTFLVTTAAQKFVLRKKPPGALLPSAHLIEREFRILHALASEDVPVPRVRVLCEDPNIIGTPFYVMDHVAGRVIDDVGLPTLAPRERHALYMDFIRVLAALHRVDWRALGLADFGKPHQFIARQIDRWSRQYLASKTDDESTMEELAAWLRAHMPADEETSLVHGDYRLGNVILHPTEPRVVAVLDWELATLGHPLGDLAYACAIYRLPQDLEAYSGLAAMDLETLGIPTETQLLETYSRATGRPGIPDWHFFLAFSVFRLAAISQGVYARALQGNAADRRGQEYGRVAKIGARIGLAITREKS